MSLSAIKAKKRSSRTLGKNAEGDAMTDDELLRLVPGGLAHAFVVSKLHEIRLAVAGLGSEPNWQGNMPELPADIAAEDHDSLSNMLAAFTNAYSTAIWHASMALIEAGLYDEIVDFLKAVVMKEATGSSKEKRDAEVITDGRVVAAKALSRIAHSDYIRFRDVASTLKTKIATVSRVGGFVGDEAGAENASSIKSSTRGKSAGRGKGNAKGNVRRTPKR